MDDEEIEQIIAKFRNLLNSHGFGWAREQAEATHDTTRDRCELAHSLLNAAETVTVHLAEMELSMLGAFRGEVDFEADGKGYLDADEIEAPESSEERRKFDRVRGSQRRELLNELSEKRAAFQKLRDLIDDNN
jgi:hypothetical protein